MKAKIAGAGESADERGFGDWRICGVAMALDLTGARPAVDKLANAA